MNKQEHIELRKLLHRHAEASGGEKKTAEIITSILEPTRPEKIVKEIGGNGIASIYSSENEGPTILFRCDMDALLIPETIQLEYSSYNSGTSHKCGHDGHMTIMLGLAQRIADKQLKTGKAILLFQPDEETGKGARLVLDDVKFQELVPKPDFVFALHNIPGYPLGQVIIKENTFASASIGLSVDLFGATSHAAEPHKGRSPAMAIAQMIQSLSSVPQINTALHEAGQVTIIHARLGEEAFGTSPGYGQVMATLRSHSTEVLANLKKACERVVTGISKAYELDFKIQWKEEFPATINNREAVKIVEDSARELNLSIDHDPTPFPWSEDFGHFTQTYPGAMFGLGAREDHPALHHPAYDFPDELIETGINLFENILYRIEQLYFNDAKIPQ
ncbi:amidohydrolase [Calditrichota bacterium]